MADAQADAGGIDEAAVTEARGWGIKTLHFLTALVMALVIAFFGAWATSELGISAIAAPVLFVITGVWLYRQPIPSAALGSGLYATALIMFITPIVFYLPAVLGGPGNGAEEAGMFAGSVIGLFFWWFIFAVFAVVVAGLGYFANQHARRKLNRKGG